MKYKAGFKYYHSLKSRIRNGKSGNNLSGPYIFGRGVYGFANRYISEQNEDGFFEYKRVTFKGQAVQLGYGYQKEILENLFFDISLGAGKGIGNGRFFSKGLSLVSDIKVGVMF